MDPVWTPSMRAQVVTPHPWGGSPRVEAPAPWEALLDATWDAMAREPSSHAPVERVTVGAHLQGPSSPSAAAARYENPVFRITGRLGLEGTLYRDALQAGVIPAGPHGVTALREAHCGGTPMAAPRLLTFLTNWWHERVTEAGDPR